MIKEIILAIIGTGILGKIVHSVRDIWLKKLEKKKNPFSQILPEIHQVYAILNKLLNKSEANRIVLLKATNGGGRPIIGKPLYSSVMYEAYDPNLPLVKPLWQKRLLDESYIRMLARLVNEKKIILHTANMSEGILKNLYAHQKVAQSYVFKIHENEKRFIYISINYIHRTSETLEGIVAIETAIDQLRVIFSKKGMN